MGFISGVAPKSAPVSAGAAVMSSLPAPELVCHQERDMSVQRLLAGFRGDEQPGRVVGLGRWGDALRLVKEAVPDACWKLVLYERGPTG